MEKECRKCGESKQLTEFNRDSKKADGHRNDCRDCSRAAGRKYRNDHIEHERERTRKWREENREAHREYARNYHYEHREACIERSRIFAIEKKELKAKLDKIWRENNRDKRAINNQKRRAIKKALVNNLTHDQWLNCLEAFEHKCAYCGHQSEDTLSQEHVIPISKGGGYTANNIVPSCVSCNSSKNNKDMKNWFQKRKSYTKQRYDFIIKYLASFGGDFYGMDKQQMA